MRWLLAKAGSKFGYSIVLVCLTLIGFGAVSVLAEDLLRGFDSSSALQPGLVVAISKDSSKKVEPASIKDINRIYGVVVDSGDASATISNPGQKVFVATAGQYGVLASVENGEIVIGDYISLSSTDGIAAKATSDQNYILGRALENFDGKSKALTTTTNGMAVGKIATSVSPGKNPLAVRDLAMPKQLRRIGEIIAGKNVSAVRIYAALILFLATLVIATSLIWVGVRSGMVAIGRNPLSRHSVIRSIVQVLAIDVLVFVIGIFGVYLLLRV